MSAALGPDRVRPGDPMLDRRAFVVIPISAALVGCSGQSALSPEAERGRQVYLAHCTSCHSVDPNEKAKFQGSRVESAGSKRRRRRRVVGGGKAT